MPKFKLNRKKFLATLPKKRISVGMILLNEKDQILIVKPRYKDHWTFPGGVVDKDESPWEACKRETKEETGLDIKPKKLLVTVYVNKKKYNDESLNLIFYGGKLDKKQTASIMVEEKEISEYKFININDSNKYNKSFANYAIKYKKEIIKGINFGYFEEYHQ